MSEQEPRDYDPQLTKQTAQATLDFLPQLRMDLGTTDQEAAFVLRQNIGIIEKNLNLPGVREQLSTEQQEQIDQELKNAKIKLRYFEGESKE